MEIKKDEMVQQAEKLKNQASELLSKVDAKKAAGLADVFMTKVFFFGKMIAALFMLLCLLTMAGSLLYYVFAGPSGIAVPDFDDFREMNAAAEKAENDNSGDMKDLKEKNAVRSKYDSEITKLMEICSLPKEAYEEYVRKLTRIDADYRSDYIDGAIDFAKDAKKFCEKKGTDKFDGGVVVGMYDGMFNEAMEAVKADELSSKISRTAALGTCGGALLGLVLFLIIPLLIQIEENTRK